MMMHLNVEKDVRNGLSMMKYAVNHSKNFKNVDIAFYTSFLHTITSILIEITVILVLTSLPNILEVVMKYVSLAAIANIPRFYYNSLVEHKLLGVSGMKLNITNFRHLNLPKPKFKRFIQKTMRVIFCCWSFYFMPYTALFITYFAQEVKKSK
jgi:hypothetical protein